MMVLRSSKKYINKIVNEYHQHHIAELHLPNCVAKYDTNILDPYCKLVLAYIYTRFIHDRKVILDTEGLAKMAKATGLTTLRTANLAANLEKLGWISLTYGKPNYVHGIALLRLWNMQPNLKHIVFFDYQAVHSMYIRVTQPSDYDIDRLISKIRLMGRTPLKLFLFLLRHINSKTNRINKTEAQIIEYFRKHDEHISKNALSKAFSELKAFKFGDDNQPLLVQKRYGHYGRESYLMLNPFIDLK